ncbi:glycosyl hydrolase [Micromonospora sp. 4G57]|uniref:Glycosyl hydrolase n=1 Tax=Micromonospora sicca TaxID=2202420 RepID=A0ABU5JBK1_9ACTN|nr:MULTISPECIES: glycosylhydrolase-like jelly roll fold domain-containing protein [unclassified Micromonospora]MDZ5441538.1 glycosyl hydrolase [Micromonospora sp. 4G57]MDZ5489935.1 glycosyl hydrolase [Micromonospora sp. 4G53]
MQPFAGRVAAAALAVLCSVATVTVPQSAAVAQPAGIAQPLSGLDAARFAEPRPDSRPSVLWFWNGTVTSALVDRQLGELRAQGVYEAIVFPFDTTALKPAFFSEEWFAIIEHTLREAQRTGMHLWLFNDDFFPSGRGGGLVINGGKVGDRTYEPHPELRPTGLGRTSRTVTGPAQVDLGGDTTGLDVVGGRLVVDATTLNGVAVLKTGAEWSDYTLTAQARLDRGTAGIVVRATGERNGYLVDTRRDDGGVDIWRQQNGSFTLLSHPGGVPGWDPAAEHEIKVVVAGNTITPYVDGKAQPSATDGAFPRGTVGVRAVADQRSTYDEFSVTGPGGQPLYRQTFDGTAALTDFRPRQSAAKVVSAVARPAGSNDVGDFVDLTDYVTAGRAWPAPAGQWRVDTFTATPLADDNSWSFRRNYLDLLDDDAVARMLDAVPGEYYRRFPWAFGTVLRGFWDDEPFIASADAHFQQKPWSPSLHAALKDVGTTPGVAYAALFDDLGRDGRTERGRYWRAVADRFGEAYYAQQARWMSDHGVGYISNPLWDEYGPAEQIASTGDLHKENQWAQVPGTDVVFDHYAAGGRTMLPRYAASDAHQNGQERVLLEAFGAMGWQVSPEFSHALLGAFAARGINLTVMHAMWTDENNIVYPPPFGSGNPWWRTAKPLTDWIGRVMEVARGRAAAQTVLIQPQRAAEAWQGTPTQDAIDRDFTAAAYALEDAQVDFDLLDEGALAGDPAIRARAQARGGRLHVGEQSYRLAVLPQAPTLDVATVRTLTEFVRTGGTLVAVGDLPGEEAAGRDGELRDALTALFGDGTAPGERAYGAGRIVRLAAPGGLGEAARSAGVAAAVLEPAQRAVRVLRLETGKDQAFLVTNESGAVVRSTATFPAKGTPELWQPETGRTATATTFRNAPGRLGTAVPLELQPYQTVVVAFRSAARPPAAVPHLISGDITATAVSPGTSGTLRVDALLDAPGSHRVVGAWDGQLFGGTLATDDPLTPVLLNGDWTVRLNKPGAQPLDRPLGSWTAIDPAYSGSATYSRAVDLDAATLDGRRFVLDLGDVRDVAEVTVNGQAFGPLLWKPYRQDITAALRAGRNEVQVRVTNTLANRHGDHRPAGLLGPVALRPQRPVSAELAPVGDEPVYDVGLPAAPSVSPGQSRELQVRVRRFGGSQDTATVELAASGGLTVTPARTDVKFDRAGEATLQVTLTAPVDATVPGTGALTVTVGGERRDVPVTVDLATRLGQASASSTHPSFRPEGAIDGDRSSQRWGQGNGWNDATQGAFPDTLTVDFTMGAPVGRVDLYTIDSSQFPASGWGVRDADVQALVGGQWRTVAQIRGNTDGLVRRTFDPVTATALRVIVRSANDNAYSRIVELEGYPQ